MKCEYCGSELKNDDMFCPNCGAKSINKQTLKDTKNKSEKPKTLDIVRIIFMVIFSIFLVLEVVLFIMTVKFRAVPLMDLLKNEAFLAFNILLVFIPLLFCLLIQVFSGWFLILMSIICMIVVLLMMIKAPLVHKIYCAVLAFLNLVLIVFIFIFAIVWPGDKVNDSYAKTIEFSEQMYTETIKIDNDFDEYFK